MSIGIAFTTTVEPDRSSASPSLLAEEPWGSHGRFVPHDKGRAQSGVITRDLFSHALPPPELNLRCVRISEQPRSEGKKVDRIAVPEDPHESNPRRR